MRAVVFESVDVIFGPTPKQALQLLDAGEGRDAVFEKTGNLVAVHDASLFVDEGEICVLMGLSGSGKSSLMRCVNGLNKATRGRVLVHDGSSEVDITSCDAGTLRRLRMNRISMVFQQFALMPWRSIRDNVGFGLEIRGMAKPERERKVDEKLALVRLDKWAHKFPHELSGGMQQRVGLARAFATEADILLMDEPFSALDPLIRDKLQDELLSLQKKLRKTIVFVSHDLDEALKIGNRIAILEGGRIVQIGTAEDILLNPADDYVAEFVKHMNPLNVLRGTSVMTPASALRREGGNVVIAPGPIHVRVDAEFRPVGVSLAGREGRIVAADGATGIIPGEPYDFISAPVDLTLRAAIALKTQTDHPILLVDQLGRLAGLCGDEEIYRGLLRRQ